MNATQIASPTVHLGVIEREKNKNSTECLFTPLKLNTLPFGIADGKAIRPRHPIRASFTDGSEIRLKRVF